jgi:hypothetical protein
MFQFCKKGTKSFTNLKAQYVVDGTPAHTVVCKKEFSVMYPGDANRNGHVGAPSRRFGNFQPPAESRPNSAHRYHESTCRCSPVARWPLARLTRLVPHSGMPRNALLLS